MISKHGLVNEAKKSEKLAVETKKRLWNWTSDPKWLSEASSELGNINEDSFPDDNWKGLRNLNLKYK